MGSPRDVFRESKRFAKTMTIDLNTNPMLTCGQASNLIGVSQRTVKKYMERGYIAGIRLPSTTDTGEDDGDRRFYLDSVISFMRKHGLRINPALDNNADIAQYGLEGFSSQVKCIVSSMEFGAYVARAYNCRAIILGTEYGMGHFKECFDLIKQYMPRATVTGVFHESQLNTMKEVDYLDLKFLRPCDMMNVLDKTREFIRPDATQTQSDKDRMRRYVDSKRRKAKRDAKAKPANATTEVMG